MKHWIILCLTKSEIVIKNRLEQALGIGQGKMKGKLILLLGIVVKLLPTEICSKETIRSPSSNGSSNEIVHVHQNRSSNVSITEKY